MGSSKVDRGVRQPAPAPLNPPQRKNKMVLDQDNDRDIIDIDERLKSLEKFMKETLPS